MYGTGSNAVGAGANSTVGRPEVVNRTCWPMLVPYALDTTSW